MTTTKTWRSEYFYGTKISEYGLENGYVDYRTLASTFDAVPNNEIMWKTWEIGCWEQQSGFSDYDEESEEYNKPEIYQYYIVDDRGAEILQEFDEIVFYNEELDMYIWGVTHWGTSWDYVLTNIKIELDEE